MYILFFFFFFSSRRRHTRWPRDWSSDVCSSDLAAPKRLDLLRDRHDRLRGLRLRLRGDDGCAGVALLAQRRIERHRAEQRNTELAREIFAAAAAEGVAEIGRASCRERGEGAGGS